MKFRFGKTCLSIWTLVGVISMPALGQLEVRSQQALRITYASSSWNQDSTQIDSAYLFVREASSSRLARILLQETEPDSAIFSGTFSLDFQSGDTQGIEVFVPPPELRQTEEQLQQFFQMIQRNEVRRRPVVIIPEEDGFHRVDVYDTREQAERAIQALRRKTQVEQQARLAQKALQEQAQIQEAARQQAEEERRRRELERLANEASLRQLERLRQEQLEQQRAEERARKAQALKEEERRQRRAEAAQLAERALSAYRKGDFETSEELFGQSLELDPEDTSHLFRYGVSLYRNGKLEEALVQLRVAEPDESRVRERDYYVALIHYRLEEYEPALENFQKVQGVQDQTLYPSSAFYEGLIHFGYENFDLAKEAFERVIESSEDPRLDEQAEEYIQRIARALQFKKRQQYRWSLSGTAGLMYDSNVILAPDRAFVQGEAQDQESLRLLADAQLEYRVVYQQAHQWSARVSGFALYSIEDALSIADPYLGNISLPYLYKGTWGQRGWQLGLTPGFESLLMDPLQTGTPQNILNSPYLNVNNTFTMSPNWFASYIFEIRQDISRLQDSIGDDDSSAMMYKLSTNQTLLLDSQGRRILMGNLGLVLNDAEGKNRSYQRVELGANYLRPGFWGSVWMLGFAAHKLDFPKAESERSDTSLSLRTSFNKPLLDWLTWGLNASFTNNKSTSQRNNYDKFTVMSTLSFDQVF